MLTEILSCGYSYHIIPFTMGGRRPLGDYLFRLQTEGTCSAYVDGEMRPVAPGELLLFKPGDLYELRIEADAGDRVGSGDYYLVCRGDWVDRWWGRSMRPVRSGIGIDERMLSIWKHMILEKRRAGERWSELGSYLLQSLCMYMDRALKENAAEPGHSIAVFRMKRYIEEQATRPLRVEEVAAQAGLSASRSAHLFKEAFGESIMQYALKVRLNIAVERMKYSSLTLEQIAETCGLGSYPYFHRAFKAVYGETPSVCRRKWMADAAD